LQNGITGPFAITGLRWRLSEKRIHDAVDIGEYQQFNSGNRQIVFLDRQ